MSQQNDSRGGSGHRNGGARGGGVFDRQRHEHGGSQSTPNVAPLDNLGSAYNFVPLSEWVFFPPWARQISHDRPFRCGLSGHVDLELTTHTPLLVASDKGTGADRHFIRVPDGTDAIPGSSLRGMIRNVIEIATFGKFQRLDDRAVSLRDLNNKHDYIGRFTGGKVPYEQGKAVYTNLAKSAWLEFRAGRYVFTPCLHARVDYQEIGRFADGVGKAPLRWAQNDGRQPKPKYPRTPAANKYKEYNALGLPLRVQMRLSGKKPSKHRHDNKFMVYIKGTQLSSVASENSEEMVLVFTGHPGSTKHMDFAFRPLQACDSEARAVPDEVMQAFHQIYEDSEDWKKYWYPRLKRGEPVPVFYLEQDDGEMAAIGLSQMFRLPYVHRLHAAVTHTSSAHLDSARMDMAECIFGTVHDPKHQGACPSLRGRVSFDTALPVDTVVRKAEPIKTILSSPKPSFYPNYVVQEEASPGKLQGRFNTLSTDGVRLRGWKRYPVRESVDVPAMTKKQRDATRTHSRLHPIVAGTRFKTKLRFHNLRPEELGAILWAVEWGEDASLRHALGMGKSLGLGQVSLRITDCALRGNDPNAQAVDLCHCREAFLRLMQEAYGEAHRNEDWLASSQMRELLAMADPRQARGKNLRAPVLDDKYNPFTLAKGAKNNQKLTLAAYTEVIKK